MKKIFIILIVLWVALESFGAAITMEDLPYLCDFEDETENANWILNPGVEEIVTTNRWVIGSTDAYTGQKSMYISNDDGQSYYYAPMNNVMMAYRDITLEAGDYDIAYDWQGMGNSTNGYLKIVYASRPTSGIKCLGNSQEPSWVASAIQLMGTNTELNAVDRWMHVNARITIPAAQANKTSTRIFFIWVNTNATMDSTNTSVRIDNFQLAKASPTDYPHNIHVATSLGESVVSWEGESESYEVLYRKKTDSQFTPLETDGNSVTLKDVEYGAYEFWICGINGEDKTVYTVFPLVYIYETDCFDALNMYNASFEYGTWNHTSGRTPKGYERIDFGAKDMRSRHTTHFDTLEIDPRTIVRSGRDTVACLRTVPKGEFGSIRLGNWNTGSEYESVTFTYNVESNANAVLIVHYAMVLENPEHTDVSQPRFTLDVLNEKGEQIDTKCATVDFHAPTAQEWTDPKIRSLWHESTSWNGRRIDWQDWKTIGISMEEYIGQTLTIVLTSYDCDQSGHFGYAYFMLNCSRSNVDGLPWGEGSTTQKFTAPNGFDYSWFNRLDTQCTDTLSREREFYVAENDTNTYICHVTYPSNPDCGYMFDASAKPHNPVAEMGWKWTPKDCSNGFTYWNRCHIGLTNQLTGEVEHRYDKQVEESYILLPDGTEQKFSYPEEGFYVPVDDEGGSYHFRVRTGVFVNNELFADTADYDIEIPAIGPVETPLYDSICQGSDVEFPVGSRIYRTQTGDYVDSLKSVVTGCDSVVTLHLTVHDIRDTTLYDTLCFNGQVIFDDKVLTQPGTYYMTTPSLVTRCDSIITLKLSQWIRPQLVMDSIACHGDDVSLMAKPAETIDDFEVIVRQKTDTQTFVFEGHQSTTDMVIPAKTLTPGICEVIIHSHSAKCGTITDSLRLTVNFASDIVDARFDDVLAIINENYNGGYTFQSFQWIVNGTEIPQATKSYYTLPDSSVQTDVYTVRLKLTDGTVLEICPFTFDERKRVDLDQITKPEQKQKIMYNGTIYMRYNALWYSILGQSVNLKMKQ